MIYPAHFNRFNYPVHLDTGILEACPPYGCLSPWPTNLVNMDTTRGFMFKVVTAGVAQELSDPSVIMFNSPVRLGGPQGMGTQSIGVATKDDIFIGAYEGTIAVGETVGPSATIPYRLVTNPTWCQPYSCLKAGVSPRGATLFAKLHEPDGLGVYINGTQSALSPGGFVDPIGGTGGSVRVSYAAGHWTLQSAGIWDITFSATVQGVLGAVDDSLIIAVNADTGATIGNWSGMRGLDVHTDATYGALNSRENVAFPATVSAPYGARIWFTNASADSINLERICVRIRQVNTYRAVLSG